MPPAFPGDSCTGVYSQQLLPQQPLPFLQQQPCFTSSTTMDFGRLGCGGSFPDPLAFLV